MAKKRSQENKACLGCLSTVCKVIILLFIVIAIFTSFSLGKAILITLGLLAICWIYVTIKHSSTSPNSGSVSIQQELARIDSMEGHAFEYWCADLLRSSGYSDVWVTRGSGDQGADIIAQKGGFKYAFQCKRYENNLGNKPIQEVYAAMPYYGCNKGVVMTNREFTDGAKQLANATGIELWGRSTIIEMLQQTLKYNEEHRKLKKRKYQKMHIEEQMWPKNRMSTKINYAHFQSLPNVPKQADMKDYIRCYPLGGESLQWNPYEQERDSDMFLVELWSDDFDSDAEKDHFFKALEKRYYALGAFVFGDLIRDKFDASKCCWLLENWA